MEGLDMPKTESEIEVLAIFDKIRRAMKDNDLEPLREYVAEDYRGCDAGGRIHGREQFLEAYGPGGVVLEAFEARDIDTNGWADTVLVMGAAVIRGRWGEHEFEHDLRFLDVYAQRENTWQLVASHVCDIVAA